MASAGQIRRSSVLFMRTSRLKQDITIKFNDGRDLNKQIVPAKFSAYYSLYSSSTLPVSFPRLAVVPDLTIKAVKKVDFSTYIDENTDPKIEEREMELDFNAFDGSGLVSPEFAQQIADELDVDYLPSTFIVRAPFLKGMVVTFDFHEFAKSVAKSSEIVDIYGNKINIKSIDMIVTESMLKLWDSVSQVRKPIFSTALKTISVLEYRSLLLSMTKITAKVHTSFCKF